MEVCLRRRRVLSATRESHHCLWRGNRITPSVVSFVSGEERLVGEAAYNMRGSLPQSTVYDVKRFIGRGFEDHYVQMDKDHFPFGIINKDGRPHIEVLRSDGAQVVFAPEEISAAVLGKMKSSAEAYLGEAVRHAVVTVPAYFDDNQRSATMVAGEIAGLNIVRIVNEPTAAAVAFGIGKEKLGWNNVEEYRVLVYDLGGGTFDVSILCLSDRSGVFETLATYGDTHLGGEDFDQNVVRYLIEQFKTKTGKDPTGNRRSMQKVKVAAERAKRVLSTMTMATIVVPDFFQGHDLQSQMSRAKFESINNKLFLRTLDCVKVALQDAGLAKDDIHEVVMVGGSTRMPRIPSMLKDFFALPEVPRHRVNPDEAIAAGAAILAEKVWRSSQASTTSPGQTRTKFSPWLSQERAVDTMQGIVLLDVTPLSLGLAVYGGAMVVLIPRNSPIPTQKAKVFSTAEDQQTTVSIAIFQGENLKARKNSKLGQVFLSGISPAPLGVPQIVVTFQINVNGILQVCAQDWATKRKVSVSMNAFRGRLAEDEVDRMVKSAELVAVSDREAVALSDARTALQAYLDSVLVLIQGTGAQKLAPQDRHAVEDAVAVSIEWLTSSRELTAGELFDKRLDVEKVVGPILSKSYALQQRENEEDDHEEFAVAVEL